MAKSKKSSKSKSSVKVQDISPKKDVKGGVNKVEIEYVPPQSFPMNSKI